jgi:CheY-like chemotaxis protein
VGDKGDVLTTILVVEDDASLRSVIRLVLESRGYAVTQAVHGADALDQLETSRPDLVLADVRMPVVDGPELVRRMRASSRLGTIPVGLLSGDVDGVKGGAGADFVVIKPFEPAELVTAIERAITPGAAKQANS